jgi:hypothetical protein
MNARRSSSYLPRCDDSFDMGLRLEDDDGSQDHSPIYMEEGLRYIWNEGSETRPLRRNMNVVHSLRILLGCILLSAMISISLATYYTFTNQQHSRMSSQFHDLASTIVDAFLRSTTDTVWTANMLSTTMTSYFQRSENSIYPNLTYPDFEIVASAAHRMVNAKSISYSPILYTEQDYMEWVSFVAKINNENTEVENLLSLTKRNLSETMNYTIRKANGEIVSLQGPEPYVPILHYYSSPVSDMNLEKDLLVDQMTHDIRRSAIQNLIEKGGPVFSRILFDRVNDQDLDASPRGLFLFPVVGSILTSELIGFIGIEFAWSDYFDFTFDKHYCGLIIVLESTIGEVSER